MQKYLLDTHSLLWARSAVEKLSPLAREHIENNRGNIYVSQISLWEIAIKQKIGKLPEFNVTLEEFISGMVKDGFLLLPLKNDHLISYYNVTYFPPDHKDPFDRLLIAIADAEKMAIITKDEKFDAYKGELTIVW